MSKIQNPIIRIGNVILDITDIVYLKWDDENSNITIKMRYSDENVIFSGTESDFKNIFTKMKNLAETNLTSPQVMIVEGE